ncbi:hypothetical protein ABFS82_14G044600 [Erythranthe guttata]|nr:PREDICTED: auxilin-like protein 1 [Erythranthe guttata]|eukprot:XP_012843026.1 PREDICTED: auxilin-like protein 1 [Erythranthe guttata]
MAASLSRPPHRRKHSATTNASSSSSAAASKSPYDDVLLSGGGKMKFQAHEYAEIFSGSSSIPVLDLSGLDERAGSGSGDYRSSNLDYSSIFGGVRVDDVAVPYEELFARKTVTRPAADPQSPFQESSSENTPDRSADGIKQHINVSFNKISQKTSDASNGKTHIAQLDSVPGFTRFVDGDRAVPPLKREVSRTWSFSVGVNGELSPNKTSNVNEIESKSHVSKVPTHNPVEVKRSRLSSFASRDSSGRTGGGHSPPPLFDEELDENSVAGVSAAALKKAIEQAQESIRIAKMIMERKKDGLRGGPKIRSDSHLEVKDDDKKETLEKRELTIDRTKEPEIVAELAVEQRRAHVVAPVKGPEINVELPERDEDCSQSTQEHEKFTREANEERDNLVGCTGKQEEEFVEHDEVDNELQSPSGRGVLEEEDTKKRSENITALEENGDEEENGVMQKEEEVREVGEDGEHGVNVVHEPEIRDEEMNFRHERDEIAEREMNTFECEAGEVLKSEITGDEFEVREIASDKENDDAVDVHSYDSDTNLSDTSVVISETREPCDVELDSGAQVEGNEDSDDSLHGVVTEIFSENESLNRCSSEESFIESKLNDGVEALSSDSKTENVGVEDADDRETLPKDDNVFTTTSELHNASQEYAANTRVEELDTTNVKTESEKRTSETNEESASTSILENSDDVSAHEARAFAANANEEVKDDHDTSPGEREYVEEQNEETGQNMEKNKENLGETTTTTAQKDSKSNEQTSETNDDDQQQRIEAIKRGREREKDRIAVERAIREARERAFAEARERAAADKAAVEAKVRAERAAVERATAEARERALEKAISQRISTDARTQGDIHSPSENNSTSSRNNELKHSFSSSDLEKFDGTSSESALRRKARLERHQRLMERAAKALAEKNMRDLRVQKEQAERNRLAESLDAVIKRWATGKEGNLRALLSTLQYILGSDSGWKPIPLTEIITTAAVRKAYRKATLCVHPDKLQQRKATIQQKYICEKVFDLLKAAWNRFNSEER